MGSSFFARSTALEALGRSRYAGHLPAEWNCPIVPQGGIVAAVAARAMEQELGQDDQTLRSLSVVFAGQVQAGDIEAEVQTLRRGRSMSQCSVTVRNPGAGAGLTAVAVFGASREGFSFTDLAPPDVPPASECPSFRDPPPEGVEMRPPFPFWEHVEGRPAIGHAPWEDYEPQSSMLARWIRFDDPPRADDGTWDPLAVVALCDTMPGAVGEKLGPVERERRWLPPSADFTVHAFDECRADWILGVNRARHAGDGYASVDMEMWDMDGDTPRLVAYATQVMFFSFPKE